MTKPTEITLPSSFSYTNYKMRVLNPGVDVIFHIDNADQHLGGITLSRSSVLKLVDFLNSILWEVPPKPAEPANLAVLYSTPSGWAFRQVESKKEATTFAAEVKNERAGRKVRLVNMLADYEIADPVYEWKDI